MNRFKGKADILERGNCRELKLTDHILRMQFDFMVGCGTVTFFILRQLQEKYMARKKHFFFAFAGLKKVLVECL